MLLFLTTTIQIMITRQDFALQHREDFFGDPLHLAPIHLQLLKVYAQISLRLPQGCHPAKKKRKQLRSFRIPDFAQLLFRVRLKQSDGTIDDHRVGVLLLVEIKKAKANCQIFDFIDVMAQTNEQARHAFASYPRVNTFGMIIAFGDLWTYREYFRVDFRPSPPIRLSERLDPTFGDSNLGSDSDNETLVYPRTCAAVEAAFEAPGFARLQSRTSDNALKAVHKRLEEIGSTML